MGLHFGCGRQKQGARRIAFDQGGQSGIETLDFLVDFGGRPVFIHQQAEPIGLHTQTTRVIDGRRTAFQTPRQQQSEHNGCHRHRHPQ